MSLTRVPPQIVTAFALAGTLAFDPLNDTLTGSNGQRFKLKPPVGNEFPAQGFEAGKETFVAPPEDGSKVKVEVNPQSKRLQLLQPFPKCEGGGKGWCCWLTIL